MLVYVGDCSDPVYESYNSYYMGICLNFKIRITSKVQR